MISLLLFYFTQKNKRFERKKNTRKRKKEKKKARVDRIEMHFLMSDEMFTFDFLRIKSNNIILIYYYIIYL